MAVKIIRTFSAFKVQSFRYDFSNGGGAVGIYKTGIKIPNNAVIIGGLSGVAANPLNFGFVRYLVTGTGAASIINVGWIGNLTAIYAVAYPQAAGTMKWSQSSRITRFSGPIFGPES